MAHGTKDLLSLSVLQVIARSLWLNRLSWLLKVVYMIIHNIIHNIIHYVTHYNYNHDVS